MKTVTPKRFKKFGPCWLETVEGRERFRIIAAMRKEWTALDVLALDGVNAEDKLWAVLREEFINAPLLHEFACRCAEEALKLVDNPDPRSIAAIAAKRAWVRGELLNAELDAARAAARDAARAAAWDAARAAAWDAARAAARDAAWAAAWDAAWAAAWDAARAAARDAARDAAWAAAWDAAWAAAWDAARAAARDAARDAARAAARDAAWAAAWDAARAAARDAQVQILKEMLNAQNKSFVEDGKENT